MKRADKGASTAKTAKAERLDIYAFALGGLAALAADCSTLDSRVRDRLTKRQAAVDRLGPSLLPAFKASLKEPLPHDYALVELARQFSLTLVEVLCVRLTMAVEEDVEVGHVIAQLQAPSAGHRPTVGLLAHAFGESLGARAVQVIGHGEAVRHGILRLSGEDGPLADRLLSVPLPTCLALQGVMVDWPGTRGLQLAMAVPFGRETDAAIDRLAQQLAAAEQPEVLVIRAGEPVETRAAIDQLCRKMESPAVLVETEQLDGLAPWLFTNRAVPVFQMILAPGDRRPAPQITGFPGPTIVATGTDGEFESEGRRVIDWRIPMPAREERFDLWKAHVPEPLARSLSLEHRHSAARIATLGRELSYLAAEGTPTMEHVEAAARRVPSGLGAMAEMVLDDIPEGALVVSGGLRQDLDELVQRCRLRDGLVDGLGPALRARYRPGVRALFVGPSGTGKTLAASWVATRLGLPLFRVDLASVTSKYIGETEKNLSQLLGRAEESEIVLLFDEADSLFGKRTEVRDAHDRFANAQTNFLLQRLENYDGIVLLTSNTRGRFDQAFARRLDLVVEFPTPGAEERRALWLAHLGAQHTLPPAAVNRISAVAELTGGQIRTAVLSAAIRANRQGGALGSPIGWDDLAAGLGAEYRKLGRQLPEELQPKTPAVV
ncbi:MAG: ATP-binding protein [Acidobacteriota bacterium]